MQRIVKEWLAYLPCAPFTREWRCVQLDSGAFQFEYFDSEEGDWIIDADIRPEIGYAFCK